MLVDQLKVLNTRGFLSLRVKQRAGACRAYTLLRVCVVTVRPDPCRGLTERPQLLNFLRGFKCAGLKRDTQSGLGRMERTLSGMTRRDEKRTSWMK
ncbi:hypothetical protein O3P69_002374 [Scylla paramamosain]|uniref:Uncharacterized protein n=1 Tax=Scylla paramamosain TaxID=85552 RepID=A0AAW0V6F4_SCYPA